MRTQVELNALGQPVGPVVPGWSSRPVPDGADMVGRYCRLERLSPDHVVDLFTADQGDVTGQSWTYLPYGPFADLESYRRWVERVSVGSDPLFYAVVDTDTTAGTETAGRAVGVLSYLRCFPEAGSIEVGHVHFSPSMQRSRIATESHFLVMRHVFDDLGYRRYEWKCDALNAPSRAAADRLGFRYEGIFRHAAVVKGRNRDTAWYALVDQDWPAVRTAMTTWLDPENFEDDAEQKSRLRADRPSR